MPRSRSTRARRGPCSSAASETGRSARVSPRLDELVDATRDALATGASASGRWPSSSARWTPDARGRPFAEALSRPGHLADRRAQAPLAVGRRDPRGRQLRRDRAGLRARRRGGGVGAHRGGALRRLARRPARGARGHRAPDPPQGLHGRPLPALRGQGRRRRRRAARGGLARRGASSPRSTASRGELDLDAIVEVHDDEELERGARDRRRRARHQQPRPRGLQRGPPAHLRPDRRRARPARSWCPSRASTPASRSTSSSRWGWTPC